MHDTQRRLELSLTGANLGIWTYNVSTDEFWADDRAKLMHGHAPHEVHTFAEAGVNIHPEDRDRAQAAFFQAIQNHSKLQLEYRVVWPDGSIHGVASYAEFMPTGDCNEGSFYGVAQDITDRLLLESDRNRSQAALRVLEERLQTAQRAGNVGVWDWDAATGKTYWSETMWTLYGYESQPDKTGDEIWEASHHPEDQPRIKAGVAQFLASNETDYHNEFRIIQPNGSVRWIEVVAQLIRDEAGKPVRMSGVNLDITDRKQAEIALAHSRYQFERIASTTPDLVYVFDLIEECNIYVNEGIHRVLGYSQAQIASLGSSLIASLIHPDDIPGVIEGNRRFRYLDDEEVYDHELRMRHANGDYRWLRCRDAVFQRAADGTVTQTIGTAQDITDRKQAEEQLRLANYRFQVAEEASKGFLYDWNLDKGEVIRSESLTNVLGYQVSEFANTAEGWQALVHPEDFAAAQETFTAQINSLTGENVEAEYRVRHKNGEYRHVYDRALLLRDDRGRVVRVIGQTVDITKLKQTEQALRESENRFRSVANLVPDLLWDSEPNGSTNWYNQRWMEYTGQTFEQAIGWGWTDTIHPDDQAASARRYQKAVETGKSLRQEHRIRRHDGEYRWFVVNAFPLKDESGQVVKMYGAATDIHEVRVSLDALRESEERFRTLATTAPALIWYNDAQGNNLFINQQFLDFTGKSAEQIRGEGWHTLVHPDDVELYVADYLAAVCEQRSWHNCNRIRRHDGVWRWHDNYAQPLFGADGVYLGHVGVTIDNTDAIEAETALRENETRMRGQKEAFQAAVNGASLADSLAILARLVAEETAGEARTAFYIANAEGTSLHPVRGAGSMPDAYLDQVNGFAIGEDSLACGLAIPTGRPVLTRDVHEEPLWKPWVQMAQAFDYRGCWSFPIMTRDDRKGVGTFAMYFCEPREAMPGDLALAEIVTQSAAVIINSHNETQERIRAEAALRESEEKFTALFAASPAPFLVIKPDAPRFTITEVNDAYLSATMRTREEVIGRGIFEAYPDNPDDATIGGVSILRASLERVLASKQPDRLPGLKYDIARTDGTFEERWWSPINSPVLDENGEVVAIIHNANDVTEEYRAEAALRESEESIRNSF